MEIAQVNFGALESIASPNFSGGTISDIINVIVSIVFPVAGFALLIYLIVGGYRYLLSGGDPKSVQAAKGIITQALVGFLIIFFAFWIVIITAEILGLEPILNIF